MIIPADTTKAPRLLIRSNTGHGTLRLKLNDMSELVQVDAIQGAEAPAVQRDLYRLFSLYVLPGAGFRGGVATADGFWVEVRQTPSGEHTLKVEELSWPFAAPCLFSEANFFYDRSDPKSKHAKAICASCPFQRQCQLDGAQVCDEHTVRAGVQLWK